MNTRNTGAAGQASHLLQISGASVLSINDVVNNRYGESSDKIYTDVDQPADEVRSIITQNSGKRVVDNYLLNLPSTGPARAALVFPPIIYGQGRGVIKQRSVQIPELARVAIESRTAVQVGKGEACWSHVFIEDISNIFVRLVERAVQGEGGANDSGLWNREGMIFAGDGRMVFPFAPLDGRARQDVLTTVRTSPKSPI